MIPWTKMPSHWDKKGEELVVKSKFKELTTIGPVDSQVEAITNFIISYNTADFDDSLVLGESGGDEEDEEGEEDDDEEGDDEDDEDE
jgi:hypothetical protein